MQPVSNLVKVYIPNYLAGLPIPDTIGGWFRLGVRDWLALIPPTAVLAGVSYGAYTAYQNYKLVGRFNKSINLDSNKIVDFVDIEDITEKAVFCRCWKSKNWPYCDGAHGKHNKETGDNLGPVVVRHAEKK